MESEILYECRQLGFAAAGIATAEPAKSFNVFQKWLKSGNAAGMEYLKRNLPQRSDPRELMPGAKSVIIAALRYPANPAPGKGFSTCARGRDYHTVMREKLNQLGDFVKRLTCVQTVRMCVDSAPLLERELAIRSGVGWRGKQGQIVSPTAGCCIVLGELIVDVELQPTPPLPDECGSCRKCLEACPTGALSENGLVNCNKCLSYLTIEHKDDIPVSIADAIGETLFGCDMCTAVCPWNSKGENLVEPALRERPMPDAEAIMTMTNEDFDRQFRDTSVHRTGLDRLRRNASIILGNISRQAGT
jgi:epoxyqueuosine reductase